MVGGRTGFDQKKRTTVDAECSAQGKGRAAPIEIIEVIVAAEQRGQRCTPGKRELEVVGVSKRTLGRQSKSRSTPPTFDPDHSSRCLLGPRPACGGTH